MTSYVKLTNNQQEAIKKLKRLKVGALFMEPGTGKTLTAIQLIESTDADFVLFLTPFQNKSNILAEFKKWHMDKPFEIIGIESLSHGERLYGDIMDKLSQYHKIFMVVDESLKIKNREAIRSQLINELGENTEYRLILNGTPLSKNILDLYNQMEFLSPKILKMNYDEFMDNFVKYTEVEYANKNETKITIKGYDNLNYLYSLIAPFVYDCKLTITSKKAYEELDYPLTTTYEHYQEIQERYSSMIWNGNDTNVFLAMCQELQQSYSCEPSKFKLCKKYADDKTIFFCKFVETKQELQRKFPQSLVMTYGKGSLGLNLQAYNRIIFFDKTFDFAQKEQAEHRIYRTGQKRNCHFINLNAEIGLDRFINKNICTKETLGNVFKNLIEHDKNNVKLLFEN